MASKDGVQGTEDSTTHRPIVFSTYDNLDEVTQVQQYDGDGVNITSTNGVPNAPATGLLRAQSKAFYDNQGRVYKTRTYDVKAATGLMLGGVPGVLIAAYLVVSLSIVAIRWLVIGVVIYTSLNMLLTAHSSQETEAQPPIDA